jgi:hypothetical protein
MRRMVLTRRFDFAWGLATANGGNIISLRGLLFVGRGPVCDCLKFSLIHGIDSKSDRRMYIYGLMCDVWYSFSTSYVKNYDRV